MKLKKLMVRNLNIFKYIIFNIFKNYIIITIYNIYIYIITI